jgi:hypothetical protein
MVRWSKEDVLAYRSRDWSAFERAPAPCDGPRRQALAGSLYEQVREAVPDWPTATDRDEDLAAHVRLAGLFDRICDAQRSSSRPS